MIVFTLISIAADIALIFQNRTLIDCAATLSALRSQRLPKGVRDCRCECVHKCVRVCCLLNNVDLAHQRECSKSTRSRLSLPASHVAYAHFMHFTHRHYYHTSTHTHRHQSTPFWHANYTRKRDLPTPIPSPNPDFDADSHFVFCFLRPVAPKLSCQSFCCDSKQPHISQILHTLKSRNSMKQYTYMFAAFCLLYSFYKYF